MRLAAGTGHRGAITGSVRLKRKSSGRGAKSSHKKLSERGTSPNVQARVRLNVY